MNRKVSSRIAVVLSAPLVVVGVIAGISTHSHSLADYGSNETAEIGQEHARDAGVRHDTDVRHGDGGGGSKDSTMDGAGTS